MEKDKRSSSRGHGVGVPCLTLLYYEDDSRVRVKMIAMTSSEQWLVREV
jgi:hypothetical protein